MIPRHVYLLSAGLMLAACTGPAAERLRTRGSMLADSDAQTVRPGQPAAMAVDEAPLFRIDPDRPAAAAVADTEYRAPVQPAPTSITEEPRPR